MPINNAVSDSGGIRESSNTIAQFEATVPAANEMAVVGGNAVLRRVALRASTSPRPEGWSQEMQMRSRVLCVMLAFVSMSALGAQAPDSSERHQPLTGRAAFTDYSQEKPGVVRKITLADLPQPHETESAENEAHIVARPRDAWPQTLPGFRVELCASGLDRPRLIRTAPNGDVFVAESYAGRITVFRGIDGNGKPEQKQVFATGLRRPFGIAFYPPGPNPEWIYVGNTDSVLRFPYRNGDLKARGEPQTIVPNLPSGAGLLGGGGHWTRDIAFSPDGKKMLVSVGSYSNNDDADNNPRERNRADILEFNPDGSGFRVYAYGIRNAVGIAIQPETGELWASVNERDGLGDDLPPDYITHVQPGGFYGWPWYYMGPHQDPRHAGNHPELKDKVITPDVLLQPHFASLEMTFYESQQFPAEYRGNIFAAEHGSWNRKKRTGYEVIRVPVKNGRATGEYEDFVTGFVTPQGEVWGRPVGVTVAKDGSLLISDDASNSIWRVSYTGR
jgi:glucose/arabinose dehydrogenase